MDRILLLPDPEGAIENLSLEELQNICKAEKISYLGNTATLKCRLLNFMAERNVISNFAGSVPRYRAALQESFQMNSLLQQCGLGTSGSRSTGNFVSAPDPNVPENLSPTLQHSENVNPNTSHSLSSRSSVNSVDLLETEQQNNPNSSVLNLSHNSQQNLRQIRQQNTQQLNSEILGTSQVLQVVPNVGISQVPTTSLNVSQGQNTPFSAPFKNSVMTNNNTNLNAGASMFVPVTGNNLNLQQVLNQSTVSQNPIQSQTFALQNQSTSAQNQNVGLQSKNFACFMQQAGLQNQNVASA